ncbi:MAG: GTP pyrophosphokinase family protein [Oscillospiraceae bacterium]|nr:GTP pyrophosphokinase family protein [Oscillospiraceae bacterium]
MSINNHDLTGQLPELLSAQLSWIEERSRGFVTLMSYYRCAMMEIETKFKVLDEEYSLNHERNPISDIKTRLKRFPSIMEKLERRGLEKSLDAMEENLNDIAGVRVVCAFPEDVYTLAEAFLQQDDITLLVRKDYIANPKPNGYRSLHLIVSIPIFLSGGKREMKVEVQLRTIAMDFWASLEHQLHYKKDVEFTPEMKQELFECANISAELDRRMDQLRQRAEKDGKAGKSGVK